MKVPIKFLTGTNSSKIAYFKKVNKEHVDSAEMDLNIKEFFKAVTVAYIRDNNCLPTIRLKQEVDLGLATRGKEEGPGFSVGTYYENSNGMKVPIDETFGKTVIRALTHINGALPYAADGTTVYTSNNPYYPYTSEAFANTEKYLLENKDRRITIAPDIAKINGMPNMVITLSNIDTHAPSGSYDPSSFHIICLGVTNPLDALLIADEILPQVEQLQTEDPTCFCTDANVFDFSLKEKYINLLNAKMGTNFTTLQPVEYMDPQFDAGAVYANEEFSEDAPSITSEAIERARAEELLLSPNGLVTLDDSQSM